MAGFLVFPTELHCTVLCNHSLRNLIYGEILAFFQLIVNLELAYFLESVRHLSAVYQFSSAEGEQQCLRRLRQNNWCFSSSEPRFDHTNYKKELLLWRGNKKGG